ncbi:GNAT family N-acetyltransferase [Clostridium sp. YIM B02551]|uniref:GNAT family N-acetyltransferase n=1 Tax=Clostridium sp. YIM B02551 TaxID=2910679 RepID=UPI001EEAE886|nr:GNAT family N-acetyltransferase [Clostridium sp. YIM B02551]
MKVEYLSNERIYEFIEYCKKHKNEVDESFLYDEDMKDFKPNEDNPTFIITNEENNIVATASLVITSYYRKGKRAAFRIFHSEIDDIECYKMLMEAVVKQAKTLEKIFVFVPIINEKLIGVMEELKFTIQRYSYFLVRKEMEVPDFILPVDYEIRQFRIGKDEETWCEVRNSGFAKLKGSETPMSPEMVKEMTSGNSYLDGGLMILYHKDRPVGVVRGGNDIYEGVSVMDIGPLALIPEYQGRGLGRILLRTAMKLAKEKNFEGTVLCVNADNERAKKLYINEGFKEVEAVACYEYYL